MAMAARFASVSQDDLNLLIEDKDAKNTKKATKASVKVFNDYLREKRLEEPQDKTSLAIILKTFYAKARKSDGSSYSKSSLNSLRFGLNRHFKATQGTDIINDTVFCEANKVFLAKCVDLKRQGLAKVVHKPAILENDLRKLYECGVFSLVDPKTLQNKVFFEIMLFYCRRGRQNLRELKVTDFSFSCDDKGSRYVCKTGDELTKNRREDDDGFEGGLMYEKPGPNCPVASLELYIKHLNPRNQFLFQRPKKDAKIGIDEICYDNMVVGERMLGEKMKTISREAKLSKIYTNHSIRATSVTILDSSGFEARHIMAVSGHKSESSIRSYCQTDINTKKKMSETIMAASHGTETNSLVVSNDTSNISPIFTLSQEEFLMRDVSVSNSNSQVSKSYNFLNCNVAFNN